MNLNIGNKQYNVEIAETEELKQKGLQNRETLNEDEGMLFIFDPPETISIWMKETQIPLDIIFINEDLEVIKVTEGKPNDETLISCDDTAYVLEVNTGSGVKEGDELEFNEESEPVMKILASDGSVQYELWGGERIVSRKETKILIKKAKKAEETLQDKDYKALGKYMFKVLNKLDNRNPEYVSIKE